MTTHHFDTLEQLHEAVNRIDGKNRTEQERALLSGQIVTVNVTVCDLSNRPVENVTFHVRLAEDPDDGDQHGLEWWFRTSGWWESRGFAEAAHFENYNSSCAYLAIDPS